MSVRTIALAWAIAALPALADTPSDYAYRMALDTDDDGAFVAFELPADVYERIVRADLGDLRVFNSTGAAVPHAFLPHRQATREARGSASLPLFPLYVDAARADATDVAITVRKGAQGTAVDVATRDGQPIAAQRLAGYLVDASDVKEPITALTLPFAAATNVTTRIRIDASDDLATWRTVASDAPLLDLEYAGRRLTRSRVDVGRAAAKYLRLTWAAGQPASELASVTVEYGERNSEAPRQWRSVTGTPVADKPGEFEFDLGGLFPADRVTLELPEMNTVAPATLLTRAESSNPWLPAASGVFYRLRQAGGDVENPPFALTVPARRYWLVRVDAKSGGTGAQPPRLSVGWHPHVVVFAARGDGPFELAYGSRRTAPSAFAIDTLVPGFDRENPRKGFVAARVGVPIAAPASAALREPMDVKRWTLWGALIVATVVLGWMALRLSRRIGTRPSERDSE
jgi:hypothetical protein